jgi:hypothetical protein
MCDNSYEESGSSQLIEIPGAHLLGSDLLYPFDFVWQSEDIFPAAQAPILYQPYPPAAWQPSPATSRLGRAISLAFLIIACVACPLLIPVIYITRNNPQRPRPVKPLLRRDGPVSSGR